MKHFILLLTAAFSSFSVAASAQSQQGPSFSCVGVKQPWAVSICSDTVISQIELNIAQLYQQNKDGLRGPTQLSFVDNQLNWLSATKASCGLSDGPQVSASQIPVSAMTCLKQALQARLSAFANNAWQDPGASFETGLDMDARSKFQQKLISEGTYQGKPDGRFGPGMRKAISMSEAKHDLPQSGFVSTALLYLLGLGDLVGQNAVGDKASQDTSHTQAQSTSIAPVMPSQPHEEQRGQPDGSPGLQVFAGDWCTNSDQQLAIKGAVITFRGSKPTLARLDGNNLFIEGAEHVFFYSKDANTLQQMFDDVEGDTWVRCGQQNSSESKRAPSDGPNKSEPQTATASQPTNDRSGHVIDLECRNFSRVVVVHMDTGVPSFTVEGGFVFIDGKAVKVQEGGTATLFARLTPAFINAGYTLYADNSAFDQLVISIDRRTAIMSVKKDIYGIGKGTYQCAPLSAPRF